MVLRGRCSAWTKPMSEPLPTLADEYTKMAGSYGPLELMGLENEPAGPEGRGLVLPREVELRQPAVFDRRLGSRLMSIDADEQGRFVSASISAGIVDLATRRAPAMDIQRRWNRTGYHQVLTIGNTIEAVDIADWPGQQEGHLYIVRQTNPIARYRLESVHYGGTLAMQQVIAEADESVSFQSNRHPEGRLMNVIRSQQEGEGFLYSTIRSYSYDADGNLEAVDSEFTNDDPRAWQITVTRPTADEVAVRCETAMSLGRLGGRVLWAEERSYDTQGRLTGLDRDEHPIDSERLKWSLELAY